MLAKLEGYIAIPQIWLYAWAYRLLDKPYSFSLGHNTIRCLEKRTLKERIFVLLFPLVTLGGIGLLLLLIWAISFIQIGYIPDLLSYMRTAPLWHQLIWWVGLSCITYASFSIYKLPLVFKLLRDDLRHQPPQDRDKYHRDRKSH